MEKEKNQKNLPNKTKLKTSGTPPQRPQPQKPLWKRIIRYTPLVLGSASAVTVMVSLPIIASDVHENVVIEAGTRDAINALVANRAISHTAGGKIWEKEVNELFDSFPNTNQIVIGENTLDQSTLADRSGNFGDIQMLVTRVTNLKQITETTFFMEWTASNTSLTMRGTDVFNNFNNPTFTQDFNSGLHSASYNGVLDFSVEADGINATLSVIHDPFAKPIIN